MRFYFRYLSSCNSSFFLQIFIYVIMVGNPSSTNINSKLFTWKTKKCETFLPVEIYVFRSISIFSMYFPWNLVFLVKWAEFAYLIIQEHTSSESQHMDTFKGLLTSRTEEYIDEVLAPYFGGIMAFVKEAELRLEQNNAGDYGKHERKLRSSSNVTSYQYWTCITLVSFSLSESYIRQIAWIRIPFQQSHIKTCSTWSCKSVSYFLLDSKLQKWKQWLGICVYDSKVGYLYPMLVQVLAYLY